MKIALITGVSRKEGIGYATAEQLGLQGFHVILSARKLEQAEMLARDLAGQGITASAVRIDLLDRESIVNAAKYVKEKFQKLDVLINNAALMLNGSATIQSKDMDELNEEFETNITGTWYVTQQFYPLIAASEHGRIVNISSGAGSYGDPDFGLINFPGPALSKLDPYPITAYAITKLALNGLTIKMAKEFKADNVLVNAVCPGFTATRPGFDAVGGRPVSESVDGIIWAATLPDDGPTGQFFRDQKPLPW
jgi:NAD(P)-dependent dehydrogenase (short-subunit alcohol dehydrogenase family)